jgi:hypothetical protein
MRKSFIWALILWVCSYSYGQNRADKQKYTGPNVLGPFHIDRTVSVRDLFHLLGQTSRFNKEGFCYRTNTTYFWFSEMAHNPTQVGNVLLSNFPNCMDSHIKISAVVLSEWRTEKGIKLGSTTQEVLKAYGQPTEDIKISGTDYRWIIQGDYLVKENRYTDRKRPEIGDRALAYKISDELRSATFGIRNGKVVWIYLSNSE